VIAIRLVVVGPLLAALVRLHAFPFLRNDRGCSGATYPLKSAMAAKASG
jgi:hypothetical protein